MNKLTAAQAERLTLLAEEAAEIVQACTKILRHGYGSYNPTRTLDGTNLEQLERELGNFDVVAVLMQDRGDIDHQSTAYRDGVAAKKRSLKKYTHHQGL